MDYKRLRLSHGFINIFITKPKAEYLEKTLAAEAEGQIVKNFGFGGIVWPSVDHWSG